MSKNTVKTKAVKTVKKVKAEPLTDVEYVELEKLIEEAADSNRNLWENAKAVDKLRDQLVTAEDALRISRNENAKIHAAIAPLFHRLPA